MGPGGFCQFAKMPGTLLEQIGDAEFPGEIKRVGDIAVASW
jgi:hypothetical protein